MSGASPAANPISQPPKTFLWLNLFGRKPSWQQQLDDSELPADICELVRSVVVKSRLTASEKSDIALDLIGHFVDGRDRGKQYSKMADEFGDPTVTAALIRRSKLRSRPMMSKIFRGLFIGGGALAASYLALLAYFHLGHPDPKIDFLIDWNGNVADAAEEDKAWPVYRPLWIKHGFSEGGEFTGKEFWVEETDGPLITSSRMVEPTDEQWTVAMARLDECQDLLTAFRVGAKLPSFGLSLETDARLYADEDFAALFPHRTKEEWAHNNVWVDNFPNGPGADSETERLMGGSLIGILLPHVQCFRKAARMLHVDTRRAVLEADSERALENIVTTWGLANQVAEANCLVCALVGYSVVGIGFNQLEEVLVTDADFFTEEQLMRLQASAENVSPRAWLKYEGEKAMLLDIVQRAYTDDGNGDGRMTPEGVKLLGSMDQWIYGSGGGAGGNPGDAELNAVMRATRTVIAPASLFVCATRKEVTDKTDEFFRQMTADKELPFWLSQDLGIEEFLQANEMKHMLLGAIMPATKQVRNAMDRTIGRQEGVIAAIAIHRYYKKYDAWPNDYDEVSPEFAIEFPADQLDGSLLKFKYDDDQLLIYSIGNDLDDDGGAEHGSVDGGDYSPSSRAAIILGQPGVASTTYEGDWIVWPQTSVEETVEVSAEPN